MFEKFLGNKQAEAELASEQRQYNFGREQTITGNAVTPQDDMVSVERQNERSDLLKWQQDLDDELEQLIHFLKGETLIDGIWKPADKPYCNDRFIREVVKPQCKPFLTRNIINTNYTEKQILMDLKNTSNEIADVMADHFDKYDIKFTDQDLVLRAIKNTIKAGAFRALNGWTKKIDSTIIKRIEATHDSLADVPKKKFLGIFGG